MFYYIINEHMKKNIMVVLLVWTVAFLAGCVNQTPISDADNDVKPIETEIYLTYLSSTEDTLQYCDGENMDSDWYKKTITNQNTTNTIINEMTQNELAKATILAATSGMCKTVMEENNITVENGIAYIDPIDWSAGISIVMCSCQPEIEVNLLQLSGVNEVIFK